jgi:hypothetical protein
MERSTDSGAGVALLGEPLTPPVVGGGLLILASVVIASPTVERALCARLGRTPGVIDG